MTACAARARRALAVFFSGAARPSLLPSLRSAVPTHPVLRRLAAVLLLGLACSAHADDAAQRALGKQLFMSGAVPACAVCHTLADAGAEGAIGPVLDDLKPDAARVATALRSGLGAMPSYADSLTPEQIEAIARYVAFATGGAK